MMHKMAITDVALVTRRTAFKEADSISQNSPWYPEKHLHVALPCTSKQFP
jgi:hypothetical protein